MHDDFVSIYAFNRWANDKMLEACRKLSAEQFTAEPVPGLTPVRATVWHIAIVTEGWLKGIAGATEYNFPAESEVATPDDAARILDRAYMVFDSIAPTLTSEFVGTPRTFSRRGRTVTLPPWIILRHIVNHTTYHRGQVASKLKMFGIQQAETDLVYWAYEQIPQPK